MRKGFVGLAVLVGCLLFLAADTALAQNAQVVGTIKDESGAVIPGATVTARNSETGLVRSAVSDEHGTYRVQAFTNWHATWRANTGEQGVFSWRVGSATTITMGEAQVVNTNS